MSGPAGLIVALKSAHPAALLGLHALPAAVTAIQVRADLIGDIDPARIRQYCSCPLLYTLRSRGQDGASNDPDKTRHRRLLAAASCFDFVELEAERDMVPRLLAAIEPPRRLVSWRGEGTDTRSLVRRFATMARVAAALYLLVPRARRFVETIAPLHLLAGLRRRDVVAYDAGPAGFWTRLIAPRLGAPLIFAESDDDTAGPDLASIATLMDDYGLPALPPVRTLYGIVGRSVLCSRSPRLHNAKYRADGREAIFLPFPTLEFGEIEEAMTAVEQLAELGLSLRGLTVTAPFKEAALALAERRSTTAMAAGAANLLVRRNGGWRAETTDPQGVLDALAERRLPVRGVATAVLGCGGAGRAVAAALGEAGACVTLVNRSTRRGQTAARRLRLPFLPLHRLRPADYGLLINATPVGTDGLGTLVEPKALAATTVVVDLVYGQGVTPLVAGARERGLIAVDGLEILTHQVRHQYAHMAEVDDLPVLPHHLAGARDERRSNRSGARQGAPSGWTSD
jgi:3-dehydroquinate dehydratase / shikimate dehydrogenase